jgi:hypothetical protein
MSGRSFVHSSAAIGCAKNMLLTVLEICQQVLDCHADTQCACFLVKVLSLNLHVVRA